MPQTPAAEASSASVSFIMGYDLGPVTRRLAKRGVPDAEALEAEFRKLSTLWVHHPDAMLAPAAQVDEFWHELILDTRRYRDFCQGAFGAPIEHIADDEGTGMREEFARTLTLYRAHHGEPDPRYWSESPRSMGGK